MRERRASRSGLAAVEAPGDGRAHDWREQVKLLQPVMADEEANRAGIGRPDVAGALLSAFEGLRVGVFRERDELLPILMRAPEREP